MGFPLSCAQEIIILLAASGECVLFRYVMAAIQLLIIA